MLLSIQHLIALRTQGREIFPVVNSLSETQLALINIHAGNLIRSSRLVLFSEPFFSPLGYGCCCTCWKLVFAARSLSWGLRPPELSYEQQSHIKDF